MEYTVFTWGAGLRFEPLTAGSGTIISNLVTDNSKTAGIYAGLKIPILKSKYSKQTRQDNRRLRRMKEEEHKRLKKE